MKDWKSTLTEKEKALSLLKKSYSKMPNPKDITNFTRYEKTMEFIWVKRWSDK